MCDLNSVIEEARVSAYPVPTDKAVERAKTILVRLFTEAPRLYEVYPGPDGEIAIQTDGESGSVLVMCEAAGDLVVMDDEPYKVYSDVEELFESDVINTISNL